MYTTVAKMHTNSTVAREGSDDVMAALPSPIRGGSDSGSAAPPCVSRHTSRDLSMTVDLVSTSLDTDPEGRETRTCRGVCHSCGSTVARAVLTSAPPSSPLPSVVVGVEHSGAGPMGRETSVGVGPAVDTPLGALVPYEFGRDTSRESSSWGSFSMDSSSRREAPGEAGEGDSCSPAGAPANTGPIVAIKGDCTQCRSLEYTLCRSLYRSLCIERDATSSGVLKTLSTSQAMRPVSAILPVQCTCTVVHKTGCH